MGIRDASLALLGWWGTHPGYVANHNPIFYEGGMKMNKPFKTGVAAIGLFALLVPVATGADENARYGTKLSGFSEVLSTGPGAVFSTGSGEVSLKIDQRDREIHYKLTYEFPDAAATAIVGAQFVNQAHLHFGQRHTTGGITVWLCQSADNPAPAAAANTPPCPSPSGTVEGTILPQHVLALAAQGLPAGESGFDALLKALRAGAIYANVHTDRSSGGEIRGQVRHGHGQGKGRKD